MNLDELRSFLGLECYYKYFVPNYSEHATPFNFQPCKEVPFIGGKEQQEAF